MTIPWRDGDYREHELMRFEFAPLYLSHADVWQAAQHCRDVVENCENLETRFQVRSEVT